VTRSRVLRASVPFVAVSLVFLPASSRSSPLSHDSFGSPWTLGLGVGATTPYTYHTTPATPFSESYEHDLGNELLLSMNLAREVGKKRSIYAGVDHFHAGSGTVARIVSFSAGIRQFLGADRHEYIECLPAVYLGEWRGTGNTGLATSITSLRPGVQLGIGTQAALRDGVGIDLGIRFRYSTGWPNPSPRLFDSEDYQGIRQIAASVKIVVGI
jgi:hypothetical protein